MLLFVGSIVMSILVQCACRITDKRVATDLVLTATFIVYARVGKYAQTAVIIPINLAHRPPHHDVAELPRLQFTIAVTFRVTVGIRCDGRQVCFVVPTFGNKCTVIEPHQMPQLMRQSVSAANEVNDGKSSARGGYRFN